MVHQTSDLAAAIVQALALADQHDEHVVAALLAEALDVLNRSPIVD